MWATFGIRQPVRADHHPRVTEVRLDVLFGHHEGDRYGALGTGQSEDLPHELGELDAFARGDLGEPSAVVGGACWARRDLNRLSEREIDLGEIEIFDHGPAARDV